MRSAKLAALLAGRPGAGVYRWPAAPGKPEVASAAEDAGWRFVALDSAGRDDKAGLLEELAEAFAFPAYFGHNLDALADSLTEVGGEHGVLLLWNGWTPVASGDRAALDGVLKVFADRAAQTRYGTFVVILAGDGPALDLPELAS